MLGCKMYPKWIYLFNNGYYQLYKKCISSFYECKLFRVKYIIKGAWRRKVNNLYDKKNFSSDIPFYISSMLFFQKCMNLPLVLLGFRGGGWVNQFTSTT